MDAVGSDYLAGIRSHRQRRRARPRDRGGVPAHPGARGLGRCDRRPRRPPPADDLHPVGVPGPGDHAVGAHPDRPHHRGCALRIVARLRGHQRLRQPVPPGAGGRAGAGARRRQRCRAQQRADDRLAGRRPRAGWPTHRRTRRRRVLRRERRHLCGGARSPAAHGPGAVPIVADASPRPRASSARACATCGGRRSCACRSSSWPSSARWPSTTR